MKLIPLSKGLHAKVSDEDFEEISKYRWAISENCGGILYAKNYAMNTTMHRFIMKPDESFVK